jgi:O-antigen ligase/Tfp pilus assembly protein PilF
LEKIKRSLANIPDYIVLFFISGLLLIDFLPRFGAVDPLYPQFLYLSGLNFIMAVYLTFKIKTIGLNTITSFKKSYALWAYLGFIVLCGISFIAARNATLVIEKLIELIITFCLFINFSIILKDKIHLISKIIFIICLAAFLQSTVEFYYLKQKADQASIITALSYMAERVGNINILAASLTIKIPFLLLGITHFLKSKRIFLFITLFLASTIILLTGARAAIISIALIYILYIAYHLRINSLNKSSLWTCFSLIIPIILAVFITNIIFTKSKNKDRYVSIENRIEQIGTKDASANARLLIWNNTIQLTKTSPFIGIGLGNYKIESIPYEKTQSDDSNISLHSHNDFLEITAETGILNGLIYLSIFVYVFFINAKRVLKTDNIDSKALAMITLLMTLVYGIDSFFNFPMFRPTMVLFLCFLLIFTFINTPQINNLEASNTKIYWVLIFVSIITTYFAFLGYKASVLESLIQKDNANSFTNNILSGDEVISKLPKYKNTLSTAESFYEYAGIYYMHEKKYDQAHKYLSKADKINPNFGRIFFYKMLISNANNNIDSAYVYAKEAFYLRPRNLNFYKMSTQFARAKKDTSEILKEHKIFIQYRNIPQAWKIATDELQKANYDTNKLISFINLGLKTFPADSILLQQKREIAAVNYIKEGQFYLSKNNSNKALEFYLKALKEDSNNADTMQNLAYLYYDEANFKQAAYYFLNALKLRQFNSGRTEFFLGNCYLKMNDKENACKYFMISKSKNFPDAKQQSILYCK